MYRQWQHKAMFVTLIAYLLLHALTPKDGLAWAHIRKTYLVTQTLWFYLISSKLADTEQIEFASRYLYFGMTFMFLYFFHTEEFVDVGGREVKSD